MSRIHKTMIAQKADDQSSKSKFGIAGFLCFHIITSSPHQKSMSPTHKTMIAQKTDDWSSKNKFGIAGFLCFHIIS